MTSPPSVPGIARVCSAVVIGAEGHLVEAAAESSIGPPALRILGMPGASVRETRDRVRAAILNSGLPWPPRTITVSVLPASMPKHGTGLDLAIAAAVLTAAGVLQPEASEGCAFVAELGLDGSLRPVHAVLPALLAAARVGCTRAVVAGENGAEAVMVPGLAVVPCRSLRAVLAWLRGERLEGQPETPAAAGAPEAAPAPSGVRLDGLALTPAARLAAETSAAGGHHLCVTGPPGADIPALAAAVAALMPPAKHAGCAGCVRGLLRRRAAGTRACADHPAAVPRPALHRS